MIFLAHILIFLCREPSGTISYTSKGCCTIQATVLAVVLATVLAVVLAMVLAVELEVVLKVSTM
jgi:hypothetical protein